MKKITLTLATILLTGLLYGQDFTPPKLAIDALVMHHPSAIVDEWISYEDEDEILCHFDENGDFGTAIFTLEGKWIQSTFNTDEEELPEAVRRQLSENYAGFEIMAITRKINDEGSVHNIYIYDSENEMDYLIIMDPSGEIISKEIIAEDDTFE